MDLGKGAETVPVTGDAPNLKPQAVGRDGTAITRRQALRRGALLGGTLMWTTPVVQTLGMDRALAAEPSGTCDLYCVKYETGSGWTSIGKGVGNCVTCPTDATDGPPARLGAGAVSGSAETGFTVTLPAGCSVFDSAETGTPDEFAGQSGVWVKCGSEQQGTACYFQTLTAGATVFTVSPCDGKGISHFEVILSCCG